MMTYCAVQVITRNLHLSEYLWTNLHTNCITHFIVVLSITHFVFAVFQLRPS